jgi:serine phosphatase RsbU (regulator of sigma subunit)
MENESPREAERRAIFSAGGSLECDSVPLGLDFEAAYASAPIEPPSSGDFHAAFPLEDGRVAVVIGDVVGHGEEAAYHAGELCRAIAGCLIEGLPPEEALGFVNAAAEMSPHFDGFATVFAGMIEPDGSLTYASGGHEPALIASLPSGEYQGLGEVVTELTNTGPPLGVMGADQIHYERGTATLKRGGTLLLYTDGISEARRTRRGAMLGMPRLRELLSRWAQLRPLRLVCKIIGYARAFTGAGRRLRDDAALLALRRRRYRRP